MGKRKLNGNAVLKDLIDNILINLDELSEETSPSEFMEGGRYAFLECLEIISKWSSFHKYGIGDIEEKYPIN